jgi:hypothetical protein
MDGSSQEPSISDLVTAGLANGFLWILEEGPLWAGPGTLEPCVVCDRRIDPSEIQYEVPGPRGALPAHVNCYREWRAQSDAMRRDMPP